MECWLTPLEVVQRRLAAAQLLHGRVGAASPIRVRDVDVLQMAAERVVAAEPLTFSPAHPDIACSAVEGAPHAVRAAHRGLQSGGSAVSAARAMGSGSHYAEFKMVRGSYVALGIARPWHDPTGEECALLQLLLSAGSHSVLALTGAGPRRRRTAGR